MLQLIIIARYVIKKSSGFFQTNAVLLLGLLLVGCTFLVYSGAYLRYLIIISSIWLQIIIFFYCLSLLFQNNFAYKNNYRIWLKYLLKLGGCTSLHWIRNNCPGLVRKGLIQLYIEDSLLKHSPKMPTENLPSYIISLNELKIRVCSHFSYA